jgi:hypothetical protein
MGDSDVRELAFVAGTSVPTTGTVSVSAMRGRTRMPFSGFVYFLEGNTQWNSNNLFGISILDGGSVVGGTVAFSDVYRISGSVLYCRRTFQKDVSGIGGSTSSLYAFVKIIG